MGQPAVDISVIIPTHNRCVHLQETLGDLARQAAEGRFTYEVIVVDNNSRDDTKRTLERLASTYPVALRYQFEGRQGRCFALNAGLTAARGTIVAITDDDVRLTPQWLPTIHRAIAEEGADGVGGPVKPLWLSERPAWLTDHFVRQLGVSDHGPAAFRVTDPTHLFIGPNSAWKRSLFERLGGFDEARVNNSEDADWFLRAFHAGSTLIYQPQMLVFNKIDPARWTPRAIRRRLLRQGRSCALGLQEGGASRTICRVPLWVVRLFVELHWQALTHWLRGDRDEARWCWFSRYLYLGTMFHCFKDWLGHRPIHRPRPGIIVPPAQAG